MPQIRQPTKAFRPRTSPQLRLKTDLNKLRRPFNQLKSQVRKLRTGAISTNWLATEVIKYLKMMVLLLVLIALGFPLAIWLLNRSRYFKSSDGSQELAETLITIEERQVKLANILKEIQGEIDYLHTMSAPDLKNLIQQAESYLKLNESDLQKAGSKQEPESK